MTGSQSGRIVMKLSFRDVALMVEALEHRVQWYDDKIAAFGKGDLRLEDENLRSDLTNDASLLKCILVELNEKRKYARLIEEGWTGGSS